MIIRFDRLRVTLTLNGEPWPWPEDDLDIDEKPDAIAGYNLSFVIEPESAPE